MLGKKGYVGPLSAEDSRRIREAAYRRATGNLNDEDRKRIAHFDQMNADTKYHFIWKG